MYVTAIVDKEKCIGCKLCIFTCPDPNVIKLIGKNGKTAKVSIDEARCKGCGLCVEICPKEAMVINTI